MRLTHRPPAPAGRAHARLFRTASFRFAALYVALFAVSATLLGGAVFLAARDSLDRQLEAGVQSEMSSLRAGYAEGGLQRLRALVRLHEREARALDYLVQSPSGARLGGEIPATPGLAPGWTVFTVPEPEARGGGPERVRALVSDLGGGLLLAVGDDLGRIADMEEAIATALAWTVGLAALLGIGGGILLSRAFLARVDSIARTAEAIIGGDLARRVPLAGSGDDLDRLAGTLNRMLDRIAGLMESLRELGSDIAHDLRTPLARLYQRLEDAHTHAVTPADHRAALAGAMAEAESLLGTFSALLRIGQVENAPPRAGFRDVDLTAAAESVADAYRPDAEESGRTLAAELAPAIAIRGDRELLTQALANLVENALRHTGAGACITMRLHRARDGRICLAVADDGPGVAVADLAHLTRRFYRGERSRSTPGNGLGLSLVAAVAELHTARLALENTAPGFRASLWFTPASAC